MDKNNVGKLFDSIAGTYDRFNHLLSLNVDKSWRRRGVKRFPGGKEVLDVATGTADLAIELIRRNKAEHVTGVDISTGMMDIGREKIIKAGYEGQISLMEGSALDLPFGDCSFDGVSCAFGVRNFSDLDKGLSEMQRVLKEGGSLMILEFSYPSNPVVRAVYNCFFSNLMPVVGKAVSGNGGAYRYFRDSVKGFIWGKEMAARLESAGFTDVRYRTMSLGICTLYTAVKRS